MLDGGLCCARRERVPRSSTTVIMMTTGFMGGRSGKSRAFKNTVGSFKKRTKGIFFEPSPRTPVE